MGRRERWIALYEEVRRRHAAGEALQAISRAMNLAVGTVRKYASAESVPVPEIAWSVTSTSVPSGTAAPPAGGVIVT